MICIGTTSGGLKIPVKIPEGCLLVQSGTTFEHITGGYVMAGYHEVIYTEATKETVEKKKLAQNCFWL